MILRPYEAAHDHDAIKRIWKEVGWITKDEHEKALAPLLDRAAVAVAELNGSAECMVMADRADMRYFDQTLPIAAVTGVTTSRVARKRGLAGRLTARLVAERAAEGDAAAFLGAFELGFYDRIGFGTGSYVHWTNFAPADLVLPDGPSARIPIRLDEKDWARIHTCREFHLRQHGSCIIRSPELTHFEMLWSDNGFGLGYEEDGELTHHMWFSADNVEHGPYRVEWIAYRNAEQFFELMRLLQGLGNQIHTARMPDPPGIRIHSLLRQPFTYWQLTRKADMPHHVLTEDYWQTRILDLEACIAAVRMTGGSLRFNLRLTDPIAGYLESDAPWHGVAGDYVVTLGTESSAEPGCDESLPTLVASVNAFSRFWVGAVPASKLAWIDEFSGPAELLHTLDEELRLPPIEPGWFF